MRNVKVVHVFFEVRFANLNVSDLSFILALSHQNMPYFGDMLPEYCGESESQ